MNIAAIILAAGQASRYGDCKHLVEIKGKNLLQTLIDHLQVAGISKISVISGAWYETHRLAQLSGAELVFNPTWHEGLGNSIASGVAALDDDVDGVMLVLGDQAALQSEDFAQLIAAYDGQLTVCAHYANDVGVPAIFPKDTWGALKLLNADNGAKKILRNCDSIKPINMPSAIIDIDSKIDLANYLATNIKHEV